MGYPKDSVRRNNAASKETILSDPSQKFRKNMVYKLQASGFMPEKLT